MPFKPQPGITTSGREPAGDEYKEGDVETPDFLTYWEQLPSGDVLAINYQEPGGND